MKVSSVHAALRAATGPQHESLEIEADLEARLRDPSRRVGAVAGLLRFHREAAMVAEPHRGLLDAGGTRPDDRVAALEQALGSLKAPAQAHHVTRPACDLSTALGWLYVSEGSALGGRVMRKAMIRDGVDLTGLDFLDPHGDQTGPRWMAFLNLLDVTVADGRARADGVVAAAVIAFDRARAALVPLSTESRAA